MNFEWGSNWKAIFIFGELYVKNCTKSCFNDDLHY